MLSRNDIALMVKKVIFFQGEPYAFAGKRLLFRPGTRPIRRKYLNANSDVVRNDVLQIEYFEKKFTPGSVLWDVGSHHGHYSLFAASVAASGAQVFSFEPDKDARAVQEKNIALNHFESKIQVLSTVVSSSKGTMAFQSLGGNANSHIVKDPIAGQDDVTTLPSTTLNDLLDELPRPDFVKIDTEGAEIDILKAAGRLLENPSVQFICELHPFAWNDFGVHYEDLLETLNRYGRKIRLLDPRKKEAELPYYGTVLF